MSTVPGLDRLDVWQLVALAAALGWAWPKLHTPEHVDPVR